MAAKNSLVIRAKQALTMPEHAEALREYDPQGDLEARDEAICGVIHDAAVVVEGEHIQWVGPWEAMPAKMRHKGQPVFETDVLMPGLVECHTHAVFAGDRAQEFALRNAGRSYVEILEAGGGILQTVEAVRRASRRELGELLAPRVLEFLRRGVTTLEIKSGYGLSTADEIKSLQAVADVRPDVPCELVSCFLGAHAVPREYRERRKAYVDLVCEEMIPRVASQKLADYCDVFCDRGAFDVAEARRILLKGQEHGLKARIHAEEITASGGALLAAEIGATSADHLEYVTPEAIGAMARAGVVGVLMPAVNLFLGTTAHMAPARALLEAGCEVALSTDFNPGSAMTWDLGMMLTLGCTLYRLTPGEALRAVTIGAAKALAREDIGRLKVGARANLALFAAPHYRYLPYHFGAVHTEGVLYRGEFAYWTEELTAEE